MRELFTHKTHILLDAGQTVSGITDKERQLHILKGRAWITMEGISHDYWLHAGDTLKVVPGTLVVVEADGGPLALRTESRPSALTAGMGILARRWSQPGFSRVRAKYPATSY